MTLDIQTLSDLDIPTLYAIEQLAQVAPWSEEAFKKCWEVNYPSWVLRQDGKIIGFILISLAAGECHILNLCIHPDFQRQQFGRQLLIYALTWAQQQGAGMVYLEVRRSNHAAIHLYRQMNFKQIGERKNYYPFTENGAEDALVFARDLGIGSLEE